MRNLLEEFGSDHGIRPPTILGVREHVFTGRQIFIESLFVLNFLVVFLFLYIYFLLIIFINVQCLFSSFIHVKSGGQFCDYGSTCFGKSIKVSSFELCWTAPCI